MSYLYLFVALLTGAIKGFCGKKTSSFTSTVYDSVFANLIRMGFCLLFGFAFVYFAGDLSFLFLDASVILITVLSGVSTAVFIIFWLISVKKNAYMLMDVFLMLGVLVPLVFGFLLFDESISPAQWLGLAILLAATTIMCSYNNRIKTKLSFSGFLLLLLCGLSSGFADFSQKLFVKTSDAPVSVFNFYTYLFASLILIFSFFSQKKENVKRKSNNFLKNTFPYILVMAICLFLNSYFKTLAAFFLPSVILYPLNQALSLVLSTVMSAVFFKERITPRAIVGIFMAFVGLLFINFDNLVA